MTANAFRFPAIIVGCIWAVIFAANLVLYPLLPVPPSGFVLGFCGLGVLLILFPSLIPIQNSCDAEPMLFKSLSEWFGKRANWFSVGAVILIVLGTSIDFSLTGFQFEALNLADVRESHLVEGIEFSPLRYVSLTCKSLGLLGLAYIIVTQAPAPVMVGAFAIALLGGIIDSSSYGGRAFIRITLSLTASGLMLGSASWILKHRARVFTGGLISLGALIVAAVWFNRIRNSNINAYLMTSRDGAIMLDALGFGAAPSDVAYGFGLVVGYLFTPIGYLDHFLSVHSMEPLCGAFTFPTISARFGFDWLTVKEFVDGYYYDVGITYNIWATAFRELILDTGIWGFLPTCALIGVILRALRIASKNNPGALLLTVFIFAWLLNSPFESMMKVRYFEFAVFLSICITLASSVYKQVAPTRTPQQIDVGQAPDCFGINQP